MTRFVDELDYANDLTLPEVAIKLITEESKCLYLKLPNYESLNQTKIMALKTVAGQVRSIRQHFQRHRSTLMVLRFHRALYKYSR